MVRSLAFILNITGTIKSFTFGPPGYSMNNELVRADREENRPVAIVEVQEGDVSFSDLAYVKVWEPGQWVGEEHGFYSKWPWFKSWLCHLFSSMTLGKSVCRFYYLEVGMKILLLKYNHRKLKSLFLLINIKWAHVKFLFNSWIMKKPIKW